MVRKSLFVLMANYPSWPRRSEDQAKVVFLILNKSDDFSKLFEEL